MQHMKHIKCPDCNTVLDSAPSSFICIECEKEFKKALSTKGRFFVYIFLVFLCLAVFIGIWLGGYGDDSILVKNNPFLVISILLILMGISFGFIFKASKEVSVGEEIKTKSLEKWIGDYKKSNSEILIKGLTVSGIVLLLILGLEHYEIVRFDFGAKLVFPLVPLGATFQFMFSKKRISKRKNKK